MKTKKTVIFVSLVLVALIATSCGPSCHNLRGAFHHNDYSSIQVEKTNNTQNL